MAESSEETQSPPRRQRGSLFFPLLLIAVGVIFLLDNFGALEGDAWSYIATFWPILLIVIGLDSIYRGEGIVGAAFMLGLGVVFLLSNLGYLDLNIWQLVLRLWPLLLVAIGIDLLIGRRSWVASLVGLVVILGLLAGALWLYGVGLESGQALPGETIQQELGNAARASVVLDMAAGSLQVGTQPEPDGLIAGSVATQTGQKVRSSFSQAGDEVIYELHSSGNQVFNPVRQGSGWDWDLDLTRQVPVDLQVDFGAGEATLDLADLQASGLQVNGGVGTASVTLPARGNYDATINGAIGSIVVIVPAELGVRLNTDAALVNVQAPPDYRKEGDVYLSPGYESAQNRVNLNTGLAIGSIQIEER